MARMMWETLPVQLRDQIGAVLGSPVLAAESQAEGWSPGGADRALTAMGTRAFVKALSRSRNPFGFELHEREARNMELLPATVNAPELIDVVRYEDVDDWIALIVEDVDGDHPGGENEAAQAPAVLDALQTLPRAPGDTFPPLADDRDSSFEAWERLLEAGLPEDLPTDIRAGEVRFADAAADIRSVLAGDYLVHGDCRADNLLIDATGAVWIIDWPWAARGPRWFDGLTYLLDTRDRGRDVGADRLIQTHALFAESTPELIDTVLAWIIGLHIENSTQQAPPNMPGIRAYQRRQGIVAARWLLDRWGAQA